MKKFLLNFKLKRLIAPMVFVLFLFALLDNANAQSISGNTISTLAPTVTTNSGSITPGTIVGSDVVIRDANKAVAKSKVSYLWESASDEDFTQNVKLNLATTRDYNPGTITQTTYFRRNVSISCDRLKCGGSSTSGSIVFTVN